MQDALYKGVLYADSSDPVRVPAWLFKVAIHHYYDLCRKRKRKRHVEIPIDTKCARSNVPGTANRRPVQPPSYRYQ